MKREKEEKDNKVKYGTVSLPYQLIETIRKRIKGTGLPSVSAYVSFVLRQVLSTPQDNDEILDKESERDIKNRLKSLGYL
jgi:Arc/MetJ-type ribon-helix-helix transcriptional regulator